MVSAERTYDRRVVTRQGGWGGHDPAGDLSDPHIYAANRDEVVTGPQPEAICPGRPPSDRRSTPAMVSFGDGQHQ